MSRVRNGLARAAGAVAVAVATAVGGAAGADPPPAGDWYAAVDLGPQLRQDGPTWSAVPELGGLPPEPRFHTAVGFTGFGRIGYQLSRRLRLEVEAGWRSNSVLTIVDEYQNGRPPGSITAICAPGASSRCGAPSGGIDAISAMGNGYLDLAPGRRFDPFVGGGIGVAGVRLRASGTFHGVTGPLSPPGAVAIDDADARLAYQAIAGVAMRLSDRWTADLTYRFLNSFSHRWRTTSVGDIQLGPITGKYADHALTLGLRYRL